MAKKKQQAEQGDTAVMDLPLSRYRVHLDCPHPLGHNPCEVEATSEEDAKRAFYDRNGICDTEWEFTIERL